MATKLKSRKITRSRSTFLPVAHFASVFMCTSQDNVRCASASIRSREIDLLVGGTTADHACAAAAGLVQWDAARGGLGVVLDLGLALLGAAPPGIRPAVLDDAFQVVVI